MPLTIYHNPRCSKSRQTLELIRASGTEPEVILYLESPPDTSTILHLSRLLGLSVGELMRSGEAEYKEATDLPAKDDDEALAAWLAEHPRVLQRPIVVSADDTKAVIGRPPENVHEVLSND